MYVCKYVCVLIYNIYIYICVCVCIESCRSERSLWSGIPPVVPREITQASVPHSAAVRLEDPGGQALADLSRFRWLFQGISSGDSNLVDGLYIVYLWFIYRLYNFIYRLYNFIYVLYMVCIWFIGLYRVYIGSKCI